MRVHTLQHVPFEGLGNIAPWLDARGAELRTTQLFAGEQPPAIDEFDWLIVMGGPMGVHDEDASPWLPAEKRCIAAAVAEKKSVLGICLGAQLIAAALGERVYTNAEPEIGWFPIRPPKPAGDSPFAAAFASPLCVFHWHGQTFDLPPGATHLVESDACRNQAFSLDDHLVALQFHLETTPESARAMVAHCGDDLVVGPYVQSAAEILGATTHYRGIHATLDRVLGPLAARCDA